MAGPVIARRGPQTGQNWLDELLLGMELPSPVGMAVGPGKAASRALIAELVDAIRSGKIADPELIPKALASIKGAGKAAGAKDLSKILAYDAEGAATMAPSTTNGTLQASIGKFANPQALQNGISKANAWKNMMSNKPLKYSAIAGGLAGAGTMKFPGDDGEAAAAMAALEGLGMKPMRSNTEAAPTAMPPTRSMRSMRKPRPSINSFLPSVQDGLPEELGTDVDSGPEALEFLQGRNPAREMSNFFPNGQDNTTQDMLGFTGNQQLPEKKKNKNLLLSLLKGLW